MSGFDLQEIRESTAGKIIFKGKEHFSGISIDSRTISNSELFIALRGARFDGHNFLDDALKKGAGAIVNYPPTIPITGKTIIYVSNSLKALQDIARHRRNDRDVKVVGITGTNGKTITKEMLCAILRNCTAVLCSTGNLNNHIGLPLNLLKLDEEKLCVLEMGASKKGDIRELCDIASPDIGIITNIGPGHLEGFGSIDTVRDTKLELADHAKTVVMNADDEILSTVIEPLRRKGNKRVITYGINGEANVMARSIRDQQMPGSKVPAVSMDLYIEGFEPVNVNMRVSGWFNAYNALAASATAYLLGIPVETIKSGLEDFSGVSMRLEIKEMKGAVVISDVYNANPASMEEAIKELVRVREGRAIAVLGDMLELGSYAEEAHRKLGAWLAELHIDVFIAVGPLMALAAHEFKNAPNGLGKEVCTAVDAVSAKDMVMNSAMKGDTVLIKGSRGMNMEYILEADCAV